ncbi:MAG: peptide chain release factor 3 [Spirochaetales bacterium]|nr:peptide chain release factor 3 [Spirochaetales bacterium]
MSNSLQDEITKRRTFGIISHPDAGKTTLTEKLLLYGGGIREAGAVKSSKIDRTTTSDFMEIERQRGISVATSVMTFEYGGKIINILDTPGHKDFAEDTYRTLTAVDSVILVIDSVKGVEEQTEKLMQVCRMRAIPVIVFVNKMDREGKPPLDLMDELEEKLDIRVRPLSWPIGMGNRFKGVFNLVQQNLFLFRPGKSTIEDERILISGLEDLQLQSQIGEDSALRLTEDVQLIEGAYGEFNVEEYERAEVAPVFFGSALNNFGVRELLETFVTIAPSPLPRQTDTRLVDAEEEKFSGFIFKIHANLDPRHRDRIAFLRVCSGTFERNKMVYHVRLGKNIRYTNPYSFMAARKEVVDLAYPGDVVGLFDKGDLKIGDTLTDGDPMMYQGIPSFSPEVFKELTNLDPLKAKQLDKGIRQLTEEGLAQLFVKDLGRRKIVGTVGTLQFEVIQYRLQHEYGASCRFEALHFSRACWITSSDKTALDHFIRFREGNIAYDKDEEPVYFAENEWQLNYLIRETPSITFHMTNEYKLKKKEVSSKG